MAKNDQRIAELTQLGYSESQILEILKNEQQEEAREDQVQEVIDPNNETPTTNIATATTTAPYRAPWEPQEEPESEEQAIYPQNEEQAQIEPETAQVEPETTKIVDPIYESEDEEEDEEEPYAFGHNFLNDQVDQPQNRPDDYKEPLRTYDELSDDEKFSGNLVIKELGKRGANNRELLSAKYDYLVNLGIDPSTDPQLEGFSNKTLDEARQEQLDNASRRMIEVGESQEEIDAFTNDFINNHGTDPVNEFEGLTGKETELLKANIDKFQKEGRTETAIKQYKQAFITQAQESNRLVIDPAYKEDKAGIIADFDDGEYTDENKRAYDYYKQTGVLDPNLLGYVKTKAQLEKDIRRSEVIPDMIRGSDFLEGVHFTATNQFPQALKGIQLAGAGLTYQNAQKGAADIQSRLDAGIDPNSTLMIGGSFSQRSNTRIGGERMTIAEAQTYYKNQLLSYPAQILSKIGEIRELQDVAEVYDNPVVFDEDGLTFKDLKGMTGRQLPQMAMSALTFGIGAFAQEYGSAYIDNLYAIAEKEFGTNQPTEAQLLSLIQSGQDEAGVAVGVGIVSGSLEFIGAGSVLKRVVPTKAITSLLRGEFKKSLVNYGANATRGGFVEALTEASQGITQDIGRGLATGEEYQFDGAQTAEEAAQGGIIGFLIPFVGGSTRVIGAGYRVIKNPDGTEDVLDSDQVDKLTPESEKVKKETLDQEVSDEQEVKKKYNQETQSETEQETQPTSETDQETQPTSEQYSPDQSVFQQTPTDTDTSVQDDTQAQPVNAEAGSIIDQAIADTETARNNHETSVTNTIQDFSDEELSLQNESSREIDNIQNQQDSLLTGLDLDPADPMSSTQLEGNDRKEYVILEGQKQKGKIDMSNRFSNVQQFPVLVEAADVEANKVHNDLRKKEATTLELINKVEAKGYHVAYVPNTTTGSPEAVLSKDQDLVSEINDLSNQFDQATDVDIKNELAQKIDVIHQQILSKNSALSESGDLTGDGDKDGVHFENDVIRLNSLLGGQTELNNKINTIYDSVRQQRPSLSPFERATKLPSNVLNRSEIKALIDRRAELMKAWRSATDSITEADLEINPNVIDTSAKMALIDQKLSNLTKPNEFGEFNNPYFKSLAKNRKAETALSKKETNRTITKYHQEVEHLVQLARKKNNELAKGFGSNGEKLTTQNRKFLINEITKLTEDISGAREVLFLKDKKFREDELGRGDHYVSSNKDHVKRNQRQVERRNLKEKRDNGDITQAQYEDAISDIQAKAIASEKKFIEGELKTLKKSSKKETPKPKRKRYTNDKTLQQEQNERVEDLESKLADVDNLFNEDYDSVLSDYTKGIEKGGKIDFIDPNLVAEHKKLLSDLGSIGKPDSYEFNAGISELERKSDKINNISPSERDILQKIKISKKSEKARRQQKVMDITRSAAVRMANGEDPANIKLPTGFDDFYLAIDRITGEVILEPIPIANYEAIGSVEGRRNEWLEIDKFDDRSPFRVEEKDGVENALDVLSYLDSVTNEDKNRIRKSIGTKYRKIAKKSASETIEVDGNEVEVYKDPNQISDTEHYVPARVLAISDSDPSYKRFLSVMDAYDKVSRILKVAAATIVATSKGSGATTISPEHRKVSDMKKQLRNLVGTHNDNVLADIDRLKFQEGRLPQYINQTSINGLVSDINESRDAIFNNLEEAEAVVESFNEFQKEKEIQAKKDLRSFNTEGRLSELKEAKSDLKESIRRESDTIDIHGVPLEIDNISEATTQEKIAEIDAEIKLIKADAKFGKDKVGEIQSQIEQLKSELKNKDTTGIDREAQIKIEKDILKLKDSLTREKEQSSGGSLNAMFFREVQKGVAQFTTTKVTEQAKAYKVGDQIFSTIGQAQEFAKDTDEEVNVIDKEVFKVGKTIFNNREEAQAESESSGLPLVEVDTTRDVYKTEVKDTGEGDVNEAGDKLFKGRKDSSSEGFLTNKDVETLSNEEIILKLISYAGSFALGRVKNITKSKEGIFSSLDYFATAYEAMVEAVRNVDVDVNSSKELRYQVLDAVKNNVNSSLNEMDKNSEIMRITDDERKVRGYMSKAREYFMKATGLAPSYDQIATMINYRLPVDGKRKIKSYGKGSSGYVFIGQAYRGLDGEIVYDNSFTGLVRSRSVTPDGEIVNEGYIIKADDIPAKYFTKNGKLQNPITTEVLDNDGNRVVLVDGDLDDFKNVSYNVNGQSFNTKEEADAKAKESGSKVQEVEHDLTLSNNIYRDSKGDLFYIQPNDLTAKLEHLARTAPEIKWKGEPLTAQALSEVDGKIFGLQNMKDTIKTGDGELSAIEEHAADTDPISFLEFVNNSNNSTSLVDSLFGTEGGQALADEATSIIKNEIVENQDIVRDSKKTRDANEKDISRGYTREKKIDKKKRSIESNIDNRVKILVGEYLKSIGITNRVKPHNFSKKLQESLLNGIDKSSIDAEVLSVIDSIVTTAELAPNDVDLLVEYDLKALQNDIEKAQGVLRETIKRLNQSQSGTKEIVELHIRATEAKSNGETEFNYQGESLEVADFLLNKEELSEANSHASELVLTEDKHRQAVRDAKKAYGQAELVMGINKNVSKLKEDYKFKERYVENTLQDDLDSAGIKKGFKTEKRIIPKDSSEGSFNRLVRQLVSELEIRSIIDGEVDPSDLAGTDLQVLVGENNTTYWDVFNGNKLGGVEVNNIRKDYKVVKEKLGKDESNESINKIIDEINHKQHRRNETILKGKPKFQSSEDGTTSSESLSTKETQDFLVDRISKAFPNVDIIFKGKDFFPNGDNTRGMTINGVVYLNKDTIQPNTPLHEMGHIFMSAVKAQDPALWQKGKDLIKDTDYYKYYLDRFNDPSDFYAKEAKKQKMTPKEIDELIYEEAIVEAISDKGVKVSENQSAWKSWVADIKKFVARLILPDGYYNVDAISNLDEFLDLSIYNLTHPSSFSGTKSIAGGLSIPVPFIMSEDGTLTSIPQTGAYSSVDALKSKADNADKLSKEKSRLISKIQKSLALQGSITTPDGKTYKRSDVSGDIKKVIKATQEDFKRRGKSLTIDALNNVSASIDQAILNSFADRATKREQISQEGSEVIAGSEDPVVVGESRDLSKNEVEAELKLRRELFGIKGLFRGLSVKDILTPTTWINGLSNILTPVSNDDFYGLLDRLSPKNKALRAKFKKRINDYLINPLKTANYNFLENKAKVLNLYDDLKVNSFGSKRSANNFLKNGSDVVVGGNKLTNSQVAMIFNFIKDPSLYKKMEKGGVGIKEMNDIVAYLNKTGNEKLKVFAEGYPSVFAHFKTQINSKLIEHDVKQVGADETIDYDALNLTDAQLDVLRSINNGKLPTDVTYTPFAGAGLDKLVENNFNALDTRGDNFNAYSVMAGNLKDRQAKGELYFVGKNTDSIIESYADGVMHTISFIDFAKNASAFFDTKNMRAAQVKLGESWGVSMKDSLRKIVTGVNRSEAKQRDISGFERWLNRSIGGIMFLNLRSASLQLLSIPNFATDDPIAYVKYAASPKKRMEALKLIINSGFLQLRGANQTDVLLDELAKQKGTSKFGRHLDDLLNKVGYAPTKWADKFAISRGGAPWLAWKLDQLKDQNPDWSVEQIKNEAMKEFVHKANEAQQSTSPDRLGRVQTSTIGRYILAFTNATQQFNRIMSKSLRAMTRGENVGGNAAKIFYFLTMQYALFAFAQKAMANAFDDDEDDDDKWKQYGHGLRDSIMTSSGIKGAFISTLINAGLKAKDAKYNKTSEVLEELFSISPALGTKFREIERAFLEGTLYHESEQGLQFSDEFTRLAYAVQASTGMPLAKAQRLVEQITDSGGSLASGDMSVVESVMRAYGWSRYDLQQSSGKTRSKGTALDFFGTRKNVDEFNFDGDFDFDFDGDFDFDFEGDSEDSPFNRGVGGKTLNDGSIKVDPNLSTEEKRKTIAHEKDHANKINDGDLSYTDKHVIWKGKKHPRGVSSNGNKTIKYNGKNYKEGDKNLPWEKAAYRAEKMDKDNSSPSGDDDSPLLRVGYNSGLTELDQIIPDDMNEGYNSGFSDLTDTPLKRFSDDNDELKSKNESDKNITPEYKAESDSLKADIQKDQKSVDKYYPDQGRVALPARGGSSKDLGDVPDDEFKQIREEKLNRYTPEARRRLKRDFGYSEKQLDAIIKYEASQNIEHRDITEHDATGFYDKMSRTAVIDSSKKVGSPEFESTAHHELSHGTFDDGFGALLKNGVGIGSIKADGNVITNPAELGAYYNSFKTRLQKAGVDVDSGTFGREDMIKAIKVDKGLKEDRFFKGIKDKNKVYKAINTLAENSPLRNTFKDLDLESDLENENEATA